MTAMRHECPAMPVNRPATSGFGPWRFGILQKFKLDCFCDRSKEYDTSLYKCVLAIPNWHQ